MIGRKKAGAVLSEQEKDIQRMLTRVVVGVTQQDEAYREDNLRRWLLVCPPPVLTLLVDRLVDELGKRSESRRRPAAASLVQIGAPAVPALLLALAKRRSATVQLAVVETLTAVAPRLAPDRLLDLQYDAMIASSRVRDASVRAAVGKLMGVVRELQTGASRQRPFAVTDA